MFAIKRCQVFQRYRRHFHCIRSSFSFLAKNICGSLALLADMVINRFRSIRVFFENKRVLAKIARGIVLVCIVISWILSLAILPFRLLVRRLRKKKPVYIAVTPCGRMERYSLEGLVTPRSSVCSQTMVPECSAEQKAIDDENWERYKAFILREKTEGQWTHRVHTDKSDRMAISSLHQ